jgi:hypothetical protein
MGMKMRRRLWEALGVPVVGYGGEVWEVSGKEAEQLEKVQRCVGRQLLGCSQLVGDAVVRGELGWWRLQARRDEAKLRFLGKLKRMAAARVVRKVLAVRMGDAVRRNGKGKGWCALVLRLVEKYGLEEASQAAGQQSREAVAEWEAAVREAVQEKEQNVWQAAVAANKVLARYGRVKKELELESFVDGGQVERKSAALKVRLRGGGTSLEVQQGKYEQLERSQRVCKACGSGEVGDEEHFLLECSVLEEARNRMWEGVRVALEECGGEVVWGRFVGLGRSEKVDVLLCGGWEVCEKEVVRRVFERATRHGIWRLWKARMMVLSQRANPS